MEKVNEKIESSMTGLPIGVANRILANMWNPYLENNNLHNVGHGQSSTMGFTSKD